MSYKYNIVYKGAVIKSNTMMGIAMLIYHEKMHDFKECIYNDNKPLPIIPDIRTIYKNLTGRNPSKHQLKKYGFIK